MRTFYPENIEDVALGAAVLGTGGGGDPYIGKLMAIQAMRQHGPVTLLDLGAEEIEFYSLFMPKSWGKDWDVESALKKDLANLRKCKADAILYLEADLQTLYRHKNNDNTRGRGDFDLYTREFLTEKRKWTAEKDNVEFLNVTGFSKQQTGEAVVSWVKKFM